MKENLRTAFNTRQYMVSKDFEIYYYSDTNMKRVKNHAHNYYEFYFFIGGNVSMEINGDSYVLSSGDMILIPPHTKHHADILDSQSPYQRFIFWISQDYFNRLLDISPDYGYLMQYVQRTQKFVYHFDLFTFNAIQSKIFSLIEELHSKRFGRDSMVSLCVSELVLSINRNVWEIENPNAPKEKQSLYQNILSYIENHLEEELTLDALANEFFVSKYHISHIFKANMGISIHQYVLKKRLSLSCESILNDMEITKVFSLYGFKDYSSYYRAFKKEYGVSPKEYKELYENKSYKKM